NGTLKWRFEVFEVDGFGFANPCAAATCGSFAPEEGRSAVGSDNVTHSGGKHTHLLGSTYTAPDNVSEQSLRVIVSNRAGIGVESSFRVKITGPVDTTTTLSSAPAILSMTTTRVQDNSSCPNYDCLAMEALVDDDKAFSELSASWAYTPTGSRTFSNNASLVSASDPTQGRFRAIMNGYRDSDAGEVTLTVTDSDNLQGVLNYPLVPNAYPLTPVCAANGEDCVVPGTPKTPWYVAMGSGRSWVSDNGSSWSLGNPNILIDNGSGPDVPFHSKDLVFANSEFLAVGTAGGSRALRSSDGVNWTFAGIIDNSTNQTAEAVAYGTGKYVAMGSGRSWVSDNGSSWSLGNPNIL
ncbi:MAG: hypothetical protein QGH12_05230, partial [SAR324 cluster bacterium]|nr:hypothetical protein [SAR324 cluster bacterium]